jgi:hypothetical protein
MSAFEPAPVTALISTGAAFPADQPALMANSSEEAHDDPRRAAVWHTEHRLLKAALLYADTAEQFDSTPAWTNALLIDAGIEIRGKHASLTIPAYETVGVAADAARAYYRDLAVAAQHGLMRGTGFIDPDSLERRQAALLARPDTVPVVPPPSSANLPAAAAWESVLATQLIGTLEGFPDADMDVVLDVRERISGSRTAFRAALAEAAKDLGNAAFDDAGIAAAVRDVRVRVVDAALAELNEDLESLRVRRWLLRAVGNADVLAAVATFALVLSTPFGGPLLGASATLAAMLVAGGGSEANFQVERRAALRHRPFMVLHEAGEALKSAR